MTDQTKQPTPHRWAEVIKAWADGHTIQVWEARNRYWLDWTDQFKVPDFNSAIEDWRIKPQAKTGWINIYPSIVIEDWKPDNDYSGVWPTRKTADKHSRDNRIACIQITYTEGEGLEGDSREQIHTSALSSAHAL